MYLTSLLFYLLIGQVGFDFEVTMAASLRNVVVIGGSYVGMVGRNSLKMVLVYR